MNLAGPFMYSEDQPVQRTFLEVVRDSRGDFSSHV